MKRKFSANISWNAENRVEPYRTMLLFSFRESSVNNVKALATFHKNLISDIFKTKMVFLNPDEHDY